VLRVRPILAALIAAAALTAATALAAACRSDEPSACEEVWELFVEIAEHEHYETLSELDRVPPRIIAEYLAAGRQQHLERCGDRPNFQVDILRRELVKILERLERVR